MRGREIDLVLVTAAVTTGERQGRQQEAPQPHGVNTPIHFVRCSASHGSCCALMNSHDFEYPFECRTLKKVSADCLNCRWGQLFETECHFA